METSLAKLQFRIDPEQIYFLKFILEAYDNLTIMSTVDQREGVVELKYPSELEEDVLGVVRSMAQRLRLEEFV
ncbi:DUF4911 domain-containing protein [Thiovibrio frasassiensis]|uniref:DUF4911 domain-containing protein n=1 Tax=Thiovibrio frasassiensis TaxID=2984131 RepID=A0A9X4MHM9_9BACT|nr:DUF4911 domain-containing protein [Thiovibrio frasassiensis]MDG4476787.1 DUF4911 domain-containing protein [Thiovibrio frasassiensis]